jgi:glutathione S-transferase
MFTLYSMQRGGNSYKVRLALAMLNVRYHLVDIDILRGESRTPSFLAKNPTGQVPLLEVAPDRYLAESNAILWYVAIGTLLAPEERVDRADTLQWMFFEQRSLEPNVGQAYFWLALVKGGRELHAESIEDWMDRGHRAFKVMDRHLAVNDYFAAGHLTVADIALYATAQLSPRCDFDLRFYPALRAWMARVESAPGFVPMDWTPERTEAGAAR